MMRKLVTPVALSLAAAAAIIGLPAAHTAAATPAAHARAMTSISIMVGGMSKQIYLPNELTARLGYFTQQGLNVTLIDEASGQSSETATLAGQVQGGSGSYNHTIELQALGKGMTEVVQLTIAPGEAEMVATSKAGQIKSVADLRGRNLGVTELGSGTQTLTTILLNKQGIHPDQVHFIPVGAGETFIAGMQHNSIDAGMTTEPTISRLVQSKVGHVLVDLRTPASTRAALGGNYPFICLFMTTSYVNSHKDVVQKVVNAYVKTLKWIHTHSAEQITAMMPADYYAGNRALYLTALKAQLAMYSPDGRMPQGGPEFVLKTENLTNPSVRAMHINLSGTYDDAFVNAANR